MNSARSEYDDASSDLPKLYSIFKGKVVSIQDYGVFVKIPGCIKNGLVHVSQLSETRVEKASEICEVGENIYCKVISLEPDGSKIALSLKTVNQSTGQDLDPTNVQAARDAQRKKTGFSRDLPLPIQLDAVLDTTCKKCGGRGHLRQECFYRPGEKAYNLIEETFGWPAPHVVDAAEILSETVKSKKHKKEKKKDKKKERKEKKKDKKKNKESKRDSDHHMKRSGVLMDDKSAETDVTKTTITKNTYNLEIKLSVKEKNVTRRSSDAHGHHQHTSSRGHSPRMESRETYPPRRETPGMRSPRTDTRGIPRSPKMDQQRSWSPKIDIRGKRTNSCHEPHFHDVKKSRTQDLKRSNSSSSDSGSSSDSSSTDRRNLDQRLNKQSMSGSTDATKSTGLRADKFGERSGRVENVKDERKVHSQSISSRSDRSREELSKMNKRSPIRDQRKSDSRDRSPRDRSRLSRR